MTGPLHIIEPTLKSEAGHCYSFIASLCQAAGAYPIVVWCACAAHISLAPSVSINRPFIRVFRRLQAGWLYRMLLKAPGRIFISTATRTDLLLLDLTARGQIAPQKVFLYIHWFRSSQRKRTQLEKLAARNPEINILTPSSSIGEEFRHAGFSRIQVVPYPITPLDTIGTPAPVPGFTHLLYAGAARQDKGFTQVVDLVELLAQRGAEIPIVLQTSADHYAKYDATTRRDIARLEACRYPGLKSHAETLQLPAYRDLFAGAICLQLYSQQDFKDRVSGVTLDALSEGSPIITLSDTWIGDVVSEYDAGVVIDKPEPGIVFQAVTRIRESYASYRDKALKAGHELQIRHSARHLFQALTA